MKSTTKSVDRAGWTPPEFAKATTVCETLVRRLISAGRIPAARIGRRLVITVAPAEWLAQQAEAR